jgi:glycosyltransferase involved in cell wall biosynthesis
MAADLKTPIRFWGWLDKSDPRLAELFDTASIFIFPSEAENFPSVLLEAMAARLAIITTNAGGCPEVVGEAAILVPPRSAEGIRQALRQVVDSPKRREELAQAAFLRVQEFAWQNVAARYLDCYREIIETVTTARTRRKAGP